MMDAMRLRIDLAYDGTDFHGWAKQPHLRTVQGDVEAAIAKILHIRKPQLQSMLAPEEPERGTAAGSDSVIHASAQADTQADEQASAQKWPQLVVAGRTDTGVHALHQVCHLDIDADVLARGVGHMDCAPTEALLRRLSHVLPADIAIHDVTQAPDGFDARFSALERVYVYRICDNMRYVDPRLRNFVVAIDDRLDLDSMNAAAAHAVGLHDFGSFATPNPGGTTIREVKSAVWSRVPSQACVAPDSDCAHDVPAAESGLVAFTIVADAFAHNMVRSLVQGCLQVGRGRKSVEWFADKIAHPVREGSTGPAPAKGLTLERVIYPDDSCLAERAQAIRAKRTLV
ncbi:tRNA pseudouridine(38-40) synthase TruA [Pseudoscardovia suis]